jgi:Uma2 family endonuclease
VIELASESTVKFDLGGKKRTYERILKTPEYVVYDPAPERLQGWRLVRGRYEELAPNAPSGRRRKLLPTGGGGGDCGLQALLAQQGGE